MGQISPGGMDNAFGFTGSAGSVKDKENILGGLMGGRAVGGSTGHYFMPKQVSFRGKMTGGRRVVGIAADGNGFSNRGTMV